MHRFFHAKSTIRQGSDPNLLRLHYGLREHRVCDPGLDCSVELSVSIAAIEWVAARDTDVCDRLIESPYTAIKISIFARKILADE
jgi:hypothetical protein